MVGEGIVKTTREQRLMGLVRVQPLDLVKMGEVLVIGPNEERMSFSFPKWCPFPEGEDDG